MKFEYLTLLLALGMFSLGCSEKAKTQNDSPSAYDSVGAQTHEFEKPYRIFADGKAIDTDIGHAAPLVTDFDGDGLDDLLVGQFGDGHLRYSVAAMASEMDDEYCCLLYTSPSPRDGLLSRMPSSA